MLQEKPDIQSRFVFRMRELHAVLCALKIIGKLIDGNDLDQSYDEVSTQRFLKYTSCHRSSGW